jgi:hypothetical protein
VVAELESRGEDLSQLKIGLLPLLRQIAAGVLLPDVVVRYAGQPAAIKQLAGMPIDEQRRYVAEELPAPPARVRRKNTLAEPHGVDPDVPKLGVGGVAANGNPRDIGEMAADLILNCPDRQQAWLRLVERLSVGGAVSPAAVPTLRDAVTKRPKVFTRWSEDGDGGP